MSPAEQRRQAPADRRPTIADVARAAGVSKATVSRVLNGKPDVNSATTETILAVVEQLGYVPSASAVNLARGRARSIGLLAPALSRPWALQVIRGVAEGIETTDYSLSLFTSSRSQSSLADLHSHLRSQALDGLAIMQPPWHSDMNREFRMHDIPVVLIDDRESHSTVPSVASADGQGVVAAVEHLIGLGRRNIAMITGPVTIGCHRERLAAFRAAMDNSGLSAPENLIYEATDDSYSAGIAATAQLLERRQPFDALFVGNDAMALGAMRSLRASGIKIPDDVAICGFDDIISARYADPPLTTIYNPLYEMGGQAVRMLLDACAGQELPTEPVLLPTRLVTRASTMGSDADGLEAESDLISWADSDLGR